MRVHLIIVEPKIMTTPSDILYFPTIEFFSDAWLKAAICYWDKVYRIVPPLYAPKDSDEVREAIDAGLVESINLTEADLSDTAQKFMAFWQNAPFVPAGFEGYEDEPIRLHPEKVDGRIRGQLAALSTHVDKDGFLNLSKEIANSYILFLAESISRRRGIPKITDSEEMFTAIGYFQQDGNFDEFVYNDEGKEVTSTLALSSLIPSSFEQYSMKKVLDFRERTEEGRIAFREAVANLVEELKDIKNREFFEKRLKKFDEDLRRSQQSLASILSKGGADIGYALVTVGLPMAIGSLSLMGMIGDPWTMQSLGSSAFLGIMAVLADHTRSRRNQWTKKEASYWLALNRAFGTDDGVKLRIPQFHRKFEEFIND